MSEAPCVRSVTQLRRQLGLDRTTISPCKRPVRKTYSATSQAPCSATSAKPLPYYEEDGGFFVRTVGPDGNPHDYRISHTFGVTPLQQYLIEFPNGRRQPLSIAWDRRGLLLRPGNT